MKYLKNQEMINQKDLRIGNLIEEGWICSLLEKEAIISVESIDKPSNKMPYDILHPIILTPEILRDCGFTYTPCRISGADIWQGMPFWSCDYFTLRGRITTAKNGWVALSDYFDAQFEYLHQIQNLYYVLTSKELNVQKVYLKQLMK
jgi:hypothetical protein